MASQVPHSIKIEHMNHMLICDTTVLGTQQRADVQSPSALGATKSRLPRTTIIAQTQLHFHGTFKL